MWRKIDKCDLPEGRMLMVRCKYEVKPIFGCFTLGGIVTGPMIFREVRWPGSTYVDRTPDSITHYWEEKGKGK